MIKMFPSQLAGRLRTPDLGGNTLFGVTGCFLWWRKGLRD
jgi:hypothetical protein